jgi:hypothetical protein
MTTQWTPMRWPDSWTDPSFLDLLNGTAIDYLLTGKNGALEPVRARARQGGLHVADADAVPSGVTIVKGEWPGVKMARGGGGGAQAMGGPTGVPWVDSNGWLVRLEGALHPDTSVWVDARPADNLRPPASSYLVAIADSASRGGRWIVSLDPQLAAGVAAKQATALETWKKVADAAGFFAQRKTWPAYAPLAVVGVVSDFSGQNDFFSRELLNLSDRAGQHYQILLKNRLTDASLASLKALIYTDAEPPSDALRKQILAYVQAGGMLITSPKWGDAVGTAAKGDEHPRFSWRALGKGRIALSHADPDDPYVWANDAVVLVSHRYDLVRFWNGGATGSFCAKSPDGKQAVAHLLFYANRGPDSASVRVAGRYRGVKAWTVDGPIKVEMVPQKDAVEVRLPQVSQYVALELEV